VISGLAAGRLSIGDVISGAAQNLMDRVFGGAPWLRDLDQAAERAAHAAQARRARPVGSSGSPPPPPRSPPPPPRPPDPGIRAREVLGFEPREQLSKERIEDRRRQLAKVFHPDRQGGSTAQMQRVNQAADLLIAQLARR
jgi:hypothetical protein